MTGENTVLRAKILARKAGGSNLSDVVDIGGAVSEAQATRGMSHPRCVEQRWQPGQSGNPAGRPKNPSLETILRKHLGEDLPPDPETGAVITRLEAAARVIFSEGITKRKSRVMIALLDRLWPKPIRIQGDPDNPITITHITRRIIDGSGDSHS